jgi:hypothetical protein
VRVGFFGGRQGRHEFRGFWLRLYPSGELLSLLFLHEHTHVWDCFVSPAHKTARTKLSVSVAVWFVDFVA